jgi:hypothetical protein
MIAEMCGNSEIKPSPRELFRFILNPPIFQPIVQRYVVRPSLKVMKHRHSFFIDSSKQPPPDSFNLVNGKKGQPPVLNIRHLNAAREWKITIDTDDLDAHV